MAEWWEEYTAQPAAQPASQDGNWWDAYAADFGNVESGAESRPSFADVKGGALMSAAEDYRRRTEAGIRSGEIPLPLDPSAVPLPQQTRPERTGWDALLELADSPVSRAIQDNPLIRGFAGRVNEAAAGVNLLTLMPIASAVDAMRGDNMATDVVGSMVQQPRERAAALMPSADASFGEKLISATGGLAFDLPSAMVSKPLQAANALPRFLAATDTAVVKQLLGDAFKEAAMTARVPATTAGLSTALSVIDSGGTPEEAIKAGLADAGGTGVNFVLPLNIAGGIASRGLQGAAVNVVGEAAQNTVTNQFLPDELQRPLYDPEQLGISAVLGAPMAIALGERAPRSAPQARARELTNELTVDANRIRTPESDAVDAGRETARAIFAEADAAARPDPATNVPETVLDNSPEFSNQNRARLAELEAKPEPTLFEREEMALLQEGKPFDRQALLADLESAPEPELIRNGTRVFYPGDVKAMRAKLAEAGLSEGMRMTGEDGSDVGLYFPARLRAEVDAVLRPKPAEQAQPEPVKEGELPYRELGIPPPRKPRNRVKSAADFDPNYHDIRDFIALHGGLDAKAFAAEFNSEVPSPAENFRFFGKPLFRKSGGLQPDQLRELLQESGFLNPDSMDGVARYTPQDAYDLVDRALDGNPVYHSDGVETQNAIQNYNNEYADLSRRQEYIDEHGATPELDEEFARRADAMDRGDFEPVFSKRAKDRTATPDMFGATQRAQTTPTPRPASGDLFGAPTPRDRLDAAQRDSDARLTGPAVGMRQGDGELFAGPRPRQETIPPRSSSAPSDPTSWILRDKATGKAVMETADRRKVDALNTQKYEAVPAEQHMQEVNTKGTLAYAAARGSEIKRSQRPDTQGIEVDEATPTPEELAAFERQTAPKHPERTRPDTPIIADDNVTTGLTGIARNEDAFKHPTSKAKTLPDILRDIEPGYTASESVELGRRNVEPADTAWNIRTPDGNDVQVYQKGKTVWIDVSNLKQGQAGSRIYNAVANYAHNTKRVFVGDPAGFSEVAQKRRAEQMLSSALKFGTTDHLAPHPKQLEGNQQLGIPKLNWKDGDTAHNIRELAKVTSEVTTKEFGEIADLTYNPESKRFERPDGTEFTDADFTKLAERGRADAEAAVVAATGRNANALGPSKRALLRRSHTAGSTTLKRAVIARQLASPEGGKLAGVLAGIGERGTEYPAGKSLPNLKRVLYSKRDPQTETPAFKKWFKSSKVVDESGKPLRVYHGTPVRGITTFDPSRAGSRTDFGNVGVGIYTTPQSWVAKAYAKDPDSRTASDDLEGEVLPLYLAIENPLRVIYDENYKSRIVQAARSIGVTADPDWRGPSPGNRKFSEQFTAKAQEAGYDGVFTTDVDGGIVEAVAFRPEQIKSAIGNNGQFDPANPSILKSESAPKPKTARLTDDQVKSAKADAESRVASHWGRSAVNKLKTRGRVEFITKQEVVDRGLQTMAELDGVDGFFDPESGKAYVIVDSGAQSADLPGVLSHEVFHANAEQFLGTDGFKRLKEAFRKLKSRDKDIAAAYKRVPSDTSAAHVDEEGLAYLAQEAPKHRLSERLTDEAKLFLNRLGIPLDWLNAHAAAVRKIAALNLKDAANRGGVVSFNKDGVKYQKVFHGTPHRGIEKTGFSLQKIGTGEGAQAYGYGMYFAGNKDIAEHYRKTLSAQNDQKSNYRGLPTAYRVDGKDIARGNPDYAAADIVHIMQNYGPVEAGWLTREIGARGLDLADTRKRVKRLSSKTIGTVSGGQLYHAEIPEDSDLLDWDKPLSEQPEKVRVALAAADFNGDEVVSAWKRNGAWEHVRGEMLYKHLAGGMTRGAEAEGKHAAASKYLQSIGIPGLRYLDGNSRNAGEGSHNYVIWDETLLTPEKAQITPYYSKRDKPKPKVTGARPEELIEVRKQISSFRTLIKCLGG